MNETPEQLRARARSLRQCAQYAERAKDRESELAEARRLEKLADLQEELADLKQDLTGRAP